jgi:hypothetical protein
MEVFQVECEGTVMHGTGAFGFCSVGAYNGGSSFNAEWVDEEQVDAGSSQSRRTIAEDRKRCLRPLWSLFLNFNFPWIQIGTASCSNMAEAA